MDIILKYFQIYNNTIYSCDRGVCLESLPEKRYTNNFRVINNIVQNSTVQAFDVGVNAGSDYNISDDGTSAGGANDVTSATVIFNDAASDDYRLALTDTVAKGSGVDLTQFKLWYDQSGTPELEVKLEQDLKAGEAKITVNQTKELDGIGTQTLHMPFHFSLYEKGSGKHISHYTYELKDKSSTFLIKVEDFTST